VSGRFNRGDIRCVASGISSVSLQGKGGNLVVRATGASKINLGECACIDAEIRLSGVSQGTVHSEGVLNARLDDAARLWYVGKPQLGEIVTRGIGLVVRVDD
jgi:hypothetical protein